jgi:hypothetical protein
MRHSAGFEPKRVVKQSFIYLILIRNRSKNFAALRNGAIPLFSCHGAGLWVMIPSLSEMLL